MKKPSTLNVPPVLLTKVALPRLLLYVPPVTNTSVLPVKNPLTLKVPPVLFLNVLP